jgi:hypothetical protein
VEKPEVQPKVQPAGPPSSSETSGKGVLRLLEQRHFNAVADIRHRIHYYNTLVQQTNTKTTDQIRTLNDKFLSDLSSAGENLATPDSSESSEAWTTSLSTLKQSLETASTDFTANQVALKTAMNDFMAGLAKLVTVPAPADPITDPTSPVDQEAETTVPTPPETNTTETISTPNPAVDPESAGEANPLLAPFQDLIDTYLQDYSSILTNRESALTIPPAENVSGKAYAKFLDIYQNLSQPQPATVPADTEETTANPSPTVDTSV